MSRAAKADTERGAAGDRRLATSRPEGEQAAVAARVHQRRQGLSPKARRRPNRRTRTALLIAAVPGTAVASCSGQTGGYLQRCLADEARMRSEFFQQRDAIRAQVLTFQAGRTTLAHPGRDWRRLRGPALAGALRAGLPEVEGPRAGGGEQGLLRLRRRSVARRAGGEVREREAAYDAAGVAIRQAKFLDRQAHGTFFEVIDGKRYETHCANGKRTDPPRAR